MLELKSDEYFKTVIITVYEIKVNPFEINRNLELLSRERETIKENQMEILEPKNTVY